MAPGATLQLPAPKQPAHDDAALPSSSKAARVEDVDEVTEQSSAAARYASGGLIFPPPELRITVDTTAQYVARNGVEFESKIRADSMGSNKLAFLNETDAYHAYYRAKLDALTKGEGPLANVADASAQTNGPEETQNADDPKDVEDSDKPKEPEPFHFSVDIPGITALDLDIVKLTALFVAKRGRSFASTLAAREGNSYQFEFLRPSHSLFGFFNRLVEQYRLVMEPTPDLLRQVRSGAFGSEEEIPPSADVPAPVTGMGKGGARLGVLEEVHSRAQWDQWENARRKVVLDEETRERAAFDEIDWHDFVVVGTIELTEQDEHIDLPPPMSLREVRTMSIAQKRMAAMIMEGDQDDEEDTSGVPSRGERLTDVAAEDRETQAGPASTEAPSTKREPIKIRKDYQPKTLAERKAAAATQATICPVCGQSVPLNEMDEHVRIELSNPQYREQRRDLENRRAQHNALMEGVNPSQSLKQFAGSRTDIFGGVAEEEAQRKREQDEARKRKERETMVWDGHAASRVDTTNEFNRPEALQSEMSHIQKKFKTDQPKTFAGPQAQVDHDDAVGLASYGGHAAMQMQGATMQQEPSKIPMQPPTGPRGGGPMPPQSQSYPYNGGMPPAPFLPPHHQASLHHQGHQESPPPAAMHPMQHRPPPQQSYTLDKLADGALYPEQQWLQYHPQPIRIHVQLPDAPQTSAKCDGRRVEFAQLPLTTTIGQVRDRLQSETLEGGVGASRLKLRVNGRATTLRQTLAHWNLADGDELTLQMA